MQNDLRQLVVVPSNTSLVIRSAIIWRAFAAAAAAFTVAFVRAVIREITRQRSYASCLRTRRWMPNLKPGSNP